MKRFSLTILVTLLVIVNSYAANFFWLATRYDNNWFDGRNWSHTQGGVAVGNVCGGCVGIDYPGSTDDVFIDASTSGQVSYASQGIQMRSMTWSGTANATSELYGYGSMVVSGSVVFVSNMKINASYINLYGSGGSDVFTTAGNDMKDCNVAIGSGSYALTGDYTSSTTFGKISVGGTFSTGNFNIAVNNVSASNASTIVFNMGSSVFTCVDFNMNYSPGSQTLTINPGTSTINFTNLFYGANKSYYSVVKVANSGVTDACLAGNFTNLTINPGVNCSFSGGTTTTVTNSLTVLGTAANRISLSNYGSGAFTLVDSNGSAMAYVDIVNGIAKNNGSAFEFTTTNSTKTNSHGWDRTATPITFGSASKTYGANSFTMTASSASTGAFTYSILSGSSFASINTNTGAVTILGAGAVTVQATQAGDIDYLPKSTTASLTISQAPLTATTNAKSRIYGAANPTFDFAYSGFVNGETSVVLTTLPTGSCTAVATSVVGAYGIVGSGGSASNYSFTYSNAGSLSITPAPIVVTVNDASRTYGSANPTFSYSYSGFVNGDNASAFAIAFSSPTTGASTGSGVGSYAINAAGGNVGPNYSVVVTGGAVNSGTLTVAKASLTATAANASRLYGSANPVFTVNYSGFVNGETASVITQPTATTSATATSPVGSYLIVPSGGSATNYSFTYANGSLSISKASLTATTNGKSRIYGAANPTFDFAYSGFVNGETSVVLTTLPTGSCTAVATSVVGAYGIVGSGGSASNYSFTYSNAGSLSITPAPIVVTVNDASRTYGSANPTFSYSYSGFVNGDNASAFAIAFSSPAAGASTGSGVGSYAINAAGGNVGPNYSVVVTGGAVNSGTLTVAKASLTATAANASRLYGSANPVFTVNYSGFVNGEAANVINTQSTAATSAIATSPVGNYSIVPSGGWATNYSFIYANGSLSITQAPLTVTANNATRAYGDANPVFTMSYSGFVNGDDASVLTALPTALTSATLQSNTGTYSITASGGAAANYSFGTYQSGTLTVDQADQTITFVAPAPVSITSAPIALTASSSSGLSVSYSSSDASVATIIGSTITIVGIGTSTITASQTGDTNYNPALPVDRTLTVNNLLSQTITFGALAPVTFGTAPFTLSAVSSNSTIPVSYSSSDPLVATVNGNTVTIVAVGTVSITALQAGDANYNAASSVPQTLIVNPASQTITFGALAPVTFGATPFTLSATSSSGLPVSYSSSNTAVAAVSGNTITIVGAGTTTITASQAGNTNYNAAPNIDEALTVKLSQTITFSPIEAIAVTHVPFDLNTYASSNAGLTLTYSSSEPSVATVSGSTVTIVGPGTTTITASQAGNGTYAPAASAQHDLTVFSKVLDFSGTSVVGDTLAFGNVVVGLTSTLKFTLTNSGTEALSISGITYPSGFSGDKTNGIISVGGSLDVNVIYTPSVLQAITDVIVFASDATSGHEQLFVKGTGTKITGFEESPSQFSVYPNPSAGLFTIEGIDDSQQNLPIEIVDVSGRAMGYFPLSNSGKGKFQLDMTTASDGLYLVRIQGKNAVRIIKK